MVFENNPPLSSKVLPLTWISLEEWILIKIQGKEIEQYLHNQFTCDIKNLDKYKYSFSAHCNPMGKMISNMYVFHTDHQEMAFIQRSNIYKKQILEMQKYSIFSKITIAPDHQTTLIGIAGKKSREYLNTFFSILPDENNTIIHHKNITLLHFNKPIERFLLIIYNKSLLWDLLNTSTFEIQFNNSRQWVTLDIEAGYPLIEPTTSEIFIPQAANIHALGGISFNKGCYIGQEFITRIQFRGNNRQKLCWLTTKNKKSYNQIPKPGHHLEYQINDQTWRYVGTVLQACQMKENNIWIQAILNKPIENNTRLKVKNTKNETSSFFYLKNY